MIGRRATAIGVCASVSLLAIASHRNKRELHAWSLPWSSSPSADSPASPQPVAEVKGEKSPEPEDVIPFCDFRDTQQPMRNRMSTFVYRLQETIVAQLESIEGSGPFRRDIWLKDSSTAGLGGGGISRVYQGGSVFEKAGVNVSVVTGRLSPEAAKSMRANHSGIGDDGREREFFACGISMVLHPVNPMAPTVHLNYRYFEVMAPSSSSDSDSDSGSKGGEVEAWWFGGGCDLTPSYLFDEDVVHFHSTLKAACDVHSLDYYPTFKSWCDRYFFIPHRQEMRGVGGIFFDDLDSPSAESCFSFVQSCGNAFLPSYVPILVKHMNDEYTPAQKEWQQIRRGRYVEFNLVHDRGTKFGLATPGSRIESILVSLPLTARWEYSQADPPAGSAEMDLLNATRTARQWIS